MKNIALIKYCPSRRLNHCLYGLLCACLLWTGVSFNVPALYAQSAAGAIGAHSAAPAANKDQISPVSVSESNQVRSLRATVVSPTSVLLQWRPVETHVRAGRYEIEFADPLAEQMQPVGRVADLTGDQFLVAGLSPGTSYRFAVRAVFETDEGERFGSPVVTYATTTAAEDELTLLLVFFPADNDLSPYVNSILQRVRRGSQANPNVHTLFLTDRWGPDNTTLYDIHNGVITETGAVEEEWGVSELDTTDPDVLAWFLSYGRAQVPAQRTVVSLMGHGSGLMPHAELPDMDVPELPPLSQDGIPALPRGIEATPGDMNDGGAYMSTVALGQALAAATAGGAEPFDLLFFDQCFQDNLDVLYEVYPYAEVLIASPNYAWLSAPYHYYLPAMAPGATPERMARVIVSAYQRSLNNAHPNAIFWLPGALVPDIAAAVDTLAEALIRALDDGRARQILQAAEAAQYIDTTLCGPGLYELGPPDEMLGAGSLARQLERRFGADDSYGVSTAAQRLRATLDEIQVSARTGRPYLNPNTIWDYTDSLTILAPLQQDISSRTAWRAGTYTRTLPLQAIWPLDTDVELTITDAPRYIKEGRWADFIAAWYPNPMPPTIGEWCLNTPPAEVDTEAPETLALTVGRAETHDEVRLAWTQASLAETDNYLVFAGRPGQSGRRLIATVPQSQTSLVVKLPPGETYEFQVGAQDELGLHLARSNAVTFTGIEETVEKIIFLPQVGQ